MTVSVRRRLLPILAARAAGDYLVRLTAGPERPELVDHLDHPGRYAGPGRVALPIPPRTRDTATVAG
jgi:hypothetical protein